VIPINGVMHWLWRAADANGDLRDILVQVRRTAKAAKRFSARLIPQSGQPRIANKTIPHQAPGAEHSVHTGLDNRLEGSQRPTRRRDDARSHGTVKTVTASSAMPRRT
jgi:putative transposase